MKIGKVPNEVLEKLVFSNITGKRSEILTRPSIGEDCGVIDFGEFACVVSTDPITGASENIGSLAIHISCNDVASNGAEPIGILMTILAPENTTESDLENIMKDAGQTAANLNVEIIGGHTEITNAVNKVVISTTVIGKQKKKDILKTNEVKIGDKIIITKWAGIEGTSIIANELEDRLKDKIDDKMLKEAQEYSKYLSVIKEGIICGKVGVPYMHDVTEGGILGAVWEAAKAINKGVIIDKEAIPIKEPTERICNILNIDPLRLISSGSMLIIVDSAKSDLLIGELESSNIEASIIGEVVEKDIKIKEDGDILEIDSPDSDELYKVV
ncbi:MAG: AIR synthase [Firmicutes bacterium]|nr:AIR synthase [Bacillota bacterium]